MACPGSAWAEAQAPRLPPNAYMVEGAWAHAALETLWYQGIWPDDDDLRAGLRMMIEACRPYTGEGWQFSVEQFLFYPQLPQLYPQDDVGGYPDFFSYHRESRTAVVFDFKWGEGVWVPVERFAQGMFYAACGAGRLPVDRLILGIVQPRSADRGDPVRVWETDGGDLVEWMGDYQDALGRRDLVPGPHCRMCDAASACPALREQVDRIAAAMTLFDDTPENTVEMYAAPFLADLYRLKPAYEAWMAAIERRLLAEIDQGRGEGTGLKIVEAQARRKWIGSPTQTAHAISDLTGEVTTTYLRTAVIGITEAEAAVRKAIKDKGLDRDQAWHAFGQLSVKQSSGNRVLAAVDDPRPAVHSAPVALPPVDLDKMEDQA